MKDFVLVPDARTWDEAQQYCQVCLGGRLAVLDSEEKHRMAAQALKPRETLPGVVGDLANGLLQAVGIAASATRIKVPDTLLGVGSGVEDLWLKEAHIGLRAAPSLVPGEHPMRWQCPVAADGRGAAAAEALPVSVPCADADEAGPLLAEGAHQESVHTVDNWKWGWSVAHQTAPWRASKPNTTGYMTRGMWSYGDAGDRRAFLCEFDDKRATKLQQTGAGDAQWEAVCRLPSEGE